MVEKIGFIKAFLLETLSYNFAQIFQTSLPASKTREFILAFNPLLAPATACFKAWNNSFS